MIEINDIPACCQACLDRAIRFDSGKLDPGGCKNEEEVKDVSEDLLPCTDPDRVTGFLRPKSYCVAENPRGGLRGRGRSYSRAVWDR